MPERRHQVITAAETRSGDSIAEFAARGPAHRRGRAEATPPPVLEASVTAAGKVAA